jgi:hypothetical protein
MKPETFGRDAASITLVAVVLTLVLAFISIPVTSASVTELNVEPDVVDPGEVVTISITGKATTPWEVVWLSSSFELPLDVDEGKYSREFIGIDFPEGEKEFSVRAENIKNLRVSIPEAKFGLTVTIICDGETIKVIASKGLLKITIQEEPRKIINNVVTFSFSLPIDTSLGEINIDGEKDVEIEGDAADGETSVDLKIATSIKRIADSNRDFSLDINTEGVPEGEFLITARGTDGEIKEKTVYIGVTPTPTPSPTPAPTSSSTETSTPTPSPQPTPSPSPSPTGTSSPTPTATPVVTPLPSTSAPAPTASPTVTPGSPAPVTPTPSSSPTPSPSASQRWIPGFEVVFVIAGPLAVAYLVLRKRRK